ncbi:MAG: WipB 2 [Gammaproteobacteria bacterium]|jgi:hypothetical protein|nr:WipB 2 [Gammaproteobacteria bacterium]
MAINRTSMMLMNEEVNLDLCPAGDAAILCDPENQYTIGDLHGNAIKLLYLLIRQNFLKMSPENYQEILNIYYKNPSTLTAEDILRFKEIISQAKINPNAGKIRLIGDVLADRGEGDCYTLIILNALKGQVRIEILFSNHDLEFLLKCEWGIRFDEGNSLLDSSVTQSMHTVQHLIDRNIITRQEIMEMMDTAYKPYLKALSYSYSMQEPRINIYSHAYIGKTPLELVNVIAAISKKLGIPYDCRTNVALMHSIDAINKAFNAHVQNNTLYTLCHQIQDVYRFNLENKPIVYIDLENNPIVYIAWNRWYEDVLYFGKNPFIFFHGHDDKGPKIKNVCCLDTILGKLSAAEFRIGFLRVLFSQDKTALKVKEKPKHSEEENAKAKEKPKSSEKENAKEKEKPEQAEEENARAQGKPEHAEEKSFGKEENPNTYHNPYAEYIASLVGRGVIRPTSVRPAKPQQGIPAPVPAPQPEEKHAPSP